MENMKTDAELQQYEEMLKEYQNKPLSAHKYNIYISPPV